MLKSNNAQLLITDSRSKTKARVKEIARRRFTARLVRPDVAYGLETAALTKRGGSAGGGGAEDVRIFMGIDQDGQD